MEGESVEQLPRGPHRLTRREVEDSQRSRLHNAAIAAIADGYSTASVSTLIARAGVSRRTFYQLYSSKDDCITESLNELFARLDNQLTAAIRESRPSGWRELVTTSLHAYLTMLAAEPHVARALHVEAVIVGPPAYPFRDRMMSRFAERMRTAQQLGASVSDNPDAIQLTTAPEFVIGGIDDFIRTAMTAPGFEPSNLLDLYAPLAEITLRLLEPAPGLNP